jgi:PAS domain S-box-containing protein
MNNLNQLDSYFELFFSNNNFIAVSLHDHDHKFIRVNKKFCDILGYSENEILGMSPIAFTYADDIDKSKDFYRFNLNPQVGSAEYEKRYVTKDGRVIWAKVISRTIIDQRNGNFLTLGFVEDITKSKESEFRASFNEVQLNAILETAILGLWCVDINWQVTYTNGAFRKMLGYTDLELLNLNLKDLTHPEDLIETYSKFDKTKPGESYQALRRYKKADGNYLWVRLSVSKFPGENPKFYGLAVVEDISVEKANQEIIQSQQAKLVSNAKLSALGEMASGIAHEINNPLMIISGNLRKVFREIDEKENDLIEIKKELKIVSNTVNRITTIVSALKDFSRDAESDKLEKVIVSDIIEEVLVLTRERFIQNNIYFESISKNDADKMSIYCRKTQIVQALIGLISNAFDAVENLKDRWVKIIITNEFDLINFKIIDSGIGIPDEVSDKMLLPFFTTKLIGKAVGIGLSVANSIIISQNGQLKYEKKEPNTTFVISFKSI